VASRSAENWSLPYLNKNSRLRLFSDDANRWRGSERFRFPPDLNKAGLFQFIDQPIGKFIQPGSVLTQRLISGGDPSSRFKPSVELLKHANPIGPKHRGIDGVDLGKGMLKSGPLLDVSGYQTHLPLSNGPAIAPFRLLSHRFGRINSHNLSLLNPSACWKDSHPGTIADFQDPVLRPDLQERQRPLISTAGGGGHQHSGHMSPKTSGLPKLFGKFVDETQRSSLLVLGIQVLFIR
jgi:hypothetical protein